MSPIPSSASVALHHEIGRHCASTALADLARFHGRQWSEAFCFGLGSGLGTFYATDEHLTPRHLLHVRSGDFELRFFERIGMPLAWSRDDDPVRAEQALKEAIAQGRPALLRTDLRHLPYYGTKTSFPAHAIVAFAYDDAPAEFRVVDTERPHALAVPYAAMREARYARNHPLGHLGDFLAPDHVPEPSDLDARLVAAIVDQAASLGRTDDPTLGLAALSSLRADLPCIAEEEDWKWTARFAYQIVEKRGTGGGGFRAMYAEFLREVETRVPAMAGCGLSVAMGRSASAWTKLAMALRDASDREEPAFDEALVALGELVDREREYVELARSL